MKFEYKQNQINLLIDGKQAGMVFFVKQPNNVFKITQVFVSESHRGKGLAKQLMQQTVDFAKSKNALLLPVCSYAVAFFEKHPQHENVLKKT